MEQRKRSETTASPDFKKNLYVCGTILPPGGAMLLHPSREETVFVVGTDDATVWKKAVATPRK